MPDTFHPAAREVAGPFFKYERRACPAFGGGKLFYAVSHSSPELKLMAMPLGEGWVEGNKQTQLNYLVLILPFSSSGFKVIRWPICFPFRYVTTRTVMGPGGSLTGLEYLLE